MFSSIHRNDGVKIILNHVKKFKSVLTSWYGPTVLWQNIFLGICLKISLLVTLALCQHKISGNSPFWLKAGLICAQVLFKPTSPPSPDKEMLLTICTEREAVSSQAECLVGTREVGLTTRKRRRNSNVAWESSTSVPGQMKKNIFQLNQQTSLWRTTTTADGQTFVSSMFPKMSNIIKGEH